MKFTLTYLACLFFLISCAESENPDLQNSDTFDITSIDYLGENEKFYVILHDEKGIAIDYKQIRNGETSKFQLDKSKKHFFSTYFIRDYEYGHEEFIYTRATEDFPFGMVLRKSSSRTPTEIGKFRVIVTDEDAVGHYVTAQGWTTVLSPITNTYDEYMKLFSEEKRYLVVASQKGHSRYAYIDNPQKDKTYTLAYDTMKDFEKVISVSKSDYLEFFCQIYGMETGNEQYFRNYTLANFGSYGIDEGVHTLRYLADIKTYSTFIYGRKASNPKTQFRYYKSGDAPTQIELLEIEEIKIAKNTVSDFEYGTTVEGANYVTQFQSKKNQSSGQSSDLHFNWTIDIYEPTFSLSLPEELIAAQPTMLSDFSQMYLQSVQITKTLSGSPSSKLSVDESTTVFQYFNE